MKKFLTILLLLFSVKSSIGQNTLLNNLEAYYKLDETSGTIVSDANGRFNGTNTRVLLGAAGILNYSYTFQNGNSFVTVSNTDSLHQTTKGTYSCWIYIDSVQTLQDGYIMGNGDALNNRYGTFIYIQKGTHIPIVNFDSSGVPGGSYFHDSIVPNVWHHLVVTWANRIWTTYIDGVSTTGTMSLNPTDSLGRYFGLGSDVNNSRYYFGGKIDEVGIWNRALTSTEVSELYNSGKALPFSQWCSATSTVNPSVQGITYPASTATLTGSGTGLGALSYLWKFDWGPGVTPSIGSSNSTTTSVTGMTNSGVYEFSLSVTDNYCTKISYDTVKVNTTVISANAGTDQSITLPVNSVKLSGSGTGTSTLSYSWTQVTNPLLYCIINTSALDTTSVTGMISGAYLFQLKVTDANYNVAYDTVMITVNGQSTSGSSLLNGLMGYWPLNEGVGTIAYDFSPNGNNGISANDTLGVPGILQTAYGFNGSTSQINAGTNNTLQDTTSGTFSCWIYMYALPATDGYIMGNAGNGQNLNGVFIYYSVIASRLVTSFCNGSGTYYYNNQSNVLSAGQWYYVVLTWSSGVANMYINGAVLLSNLVIGGSPTNNHNKFGIGASMADPTPEIPFTGKIDEVGVWNRALSSYEVALLYNNGRGLIYPFNTLASSSWFF